MVASSSHSQRRQWHPTPVLLPGKSYGRRGLVGCSPWGRWESDTTERLHFHFSLSCTGEGNGNPLQCSCLENPRDGKAWWAAIYGVTQSRTWLKCLSSSSSISFCFKAPRRSAHLKRYLKRLLADSLWASIYLLLRSSHLVPWDSCSLSNNVLQFPDLLESWKLALPWEYTPPSTLLCRQVESCRRSHISQTSVSKTESHWWQPAHSSHSATAPESPSEAPAIRTQTSLPLLTLSPADTPALLLTPWQHQALRLRNRAALKTQVFPHTTLTSKPTAPYPMPTAAPQMLPSCWNSGISHTNWHLLQYRLFHFPGPLFIQPRDLQFLTIHPLLSSLSSLFSHQFHDESLQPLTCWYPKHPFQAVIHECVRAKSIQSCLTLWDPVDCALQAPPSTGFSRQEYWSGLPYPPPGDLPNQGIEHASLMSPALAGRFFATSAIWEAHHLSSSGKNATTYCLLFQT